MAPPPTPVNTREDLCRHLQWAVELELTTIPMYLAAMFSLDEGTNREAQILLRSVVMEEMLHLTLAANVLNAVRADGPGPMLTGSSAPTYPGVLKHSNGIQIRLGSFNRSTLDLFCEIERPAPRDAPPEPDCFDTIGQFYKAIEDGLNLLGEDLFARSVNLGCQIERDHAYYGGGGKVIVVSDLSSALAALNEIVAQGEGFDETIWDGDGLLFAERTELGHYYRFDEIRRERQYQFDDSRGHPTGPPILVDYDAVHEPAPDLHDRTEAELPPGVPRLMSICDETYRHLLAEIQAGLNGDRERLVNSTAIMYQLKYQATALTKIPVGDGYYAGPLFRATDD